MITTAKQLRTLADRTGLDAFAEVLRDAAGMIERLEGRVQELERAVKAEREACAELCDRLESKYDHLTKTTDIPAIWAAAAGAARGLAEVIRAHGAQGENNG